MQSHVPTLETCQKLKEAGFDQHSHFFWHVIGDTPVLSGTNIHLDVHHSYFDSEFAAPILTELLDRFPTSMVTITRYEEHRYMVSPYDEILKAWVAPNPAEAAALLWLELKK